MDLVPLVDPEGAAVGESFSNVFRSIYIEYSSWDVQLSHPNPKPFYHGMVYEIFGSATIHQCELFGPSSLAYECKVSGDFIDI